MSGRKSTKPVCQYGDQCYRKNPQHFLKFSHPDDRGSDSSSDSSDDDQPTKKPPKKKMKFDNSSPSTSGLQEEISDDNSTEGVKRVPLLLSKVRGIPQRFNGSSMATSVKDILSHKMGDLQASAQFNYMFDIPWMMDQYPADKRSKPLLLVHGDQKQKKAVLETEAKPFKNITLFQARIPDAFGTHHSKMMLLLYSNGLRVVITTGNMIQMDWDQKTQGIWISPLFPQLAAEREVDPTGTNFKQDLLNYLSAYGGTALDVWKKHIRCHDMSGAGVHLVASVPGRHKFTDKHKWGHMRLRQLLSRHGPVAEHVTPNWNVIGQFSSIGSLGNDEKKWVCAEWLQSLSTVRTKPVSSPAVLKLIYPSAENVRASLEGYPAGGSLPYSWNVASKQPWLKKFLHCWKCEGVGRSRASPHIKTYTRVSPDYKKAAWFLVTSANLSKAAWGALEKDRSQLMIRSYEIGVLFLPSGQESQAHKYFNISGQTKGEGLASTPSLQLPYDLPLTAYGKEDKPWIWDLNYSKPDTHGCVWERPS